MNIHDCIRIIRLENNNDRVEYVLQWKKVTVDLNEAAIDISPGWVYFKYFKSMNKACDYGNKIWAKMLKSVSVLGKSESYLG